MGATESWLSKICYIFYIIYVYCSESGFWAPSSNTTYTPIREHPIRNNYIRNSLDKALHGKYLSMTKETIKKNQRVKFQT